MLNENAKLWVAALRSGKYQQGKTNLCSLGRYCCLGVGAELAESSGVVCQWRGRGTLPQEVLDWLGLNSPLGCFGYLQSLASLNDVEGKTFSEIADIIESEPEGLFA